MKKVFNYTLIAAIVILIASVLYLTGFAVTQQLKGEKVTAYHRLYKNVDGQKKFNYWGILSPIQVESQKLVDTTIAFDFKVLYPIAPKFKIIAPGDTVESWIAGQMANTIADSLQKITYNLMLDYDNQAMAVREVKEIKTLSVSQPHLYLSLHGTASPEAAKYGFRSSIKPGVLEPENAEVAQARVERTTPLLLENLKSRGLDSVTVTSVTSQEVQFSETDEVDSITAVMMLPDMRYVKVFGQAVLTQVQITPATAPIALPLQLLGLSLLGLLLMRLFNRKPATFIQEPVGKVTPPVQVTYVPEISEKGINWWDILYVLLCVGALIVGYYFFKYIISVILIAGMLYCLCRALKPLYELYQESDLRDWFTEKRSYWATKPWTCKFVALWFIVTFLLGIFALVTCLLGYWHICF